jgi:ubiquinone/menaquinone biosynthesis C-methylase UbiE
MAKQEEREFHDRYITGEGNLRSRESRFYSSTAESMETAIALDFLGDLHGKRLLFYGSGGHFSLIRKFVQQGAEVIAIDISPETVAGLRRAIELEGYANQSSAIEMDCESLDFADESFDFVFARSIIHHLNVDTSLKEIKRVLKPDGKLAVLEPLGTNPLINLYRWITPNSRTADEHPLANADLKTFKDYFPESKFHYLYFVSIIAYFYRMLDGNEQRFKKVFLFLNAVDKFFLRLFPPYRYLCWDVLLCCQKKSHRYHKAVVGQRKSCAVSLG